MTMVEDPTQRLGKHIRGVHDCGKVNQDDILHQSPMLTCKVSDFDMWSLSWMPMIGKRVICRSVSGLMT